MSGNQQSGVIALAAGGTGGHLFPAQALAEALSARGYEIHLITDERVEHYGKTFPAVATHIVPSASLSLSNPMRVPRNAFRLAYGVLKARSVLKSLKPRAVVGFGGYPSLPPLLAARNLGLATIIHEQNAVLGRANKLLAGGVSAIATSFPSVVGLKDSNRAKLVFCGNPVRQTVRDVAGSKFPRLDATSSIQLVIFGGSQGARFFSDVMPAAVKLLPAALRKRLAIVQQCRSEDLERVRASYHGLVERVSLAAFFGNMPHLLAESHLVICRSGASTVAELGVIGRPAILVPLPHAIDNDQQKNAESFAAAGAGFIRPQSDLTPENLAELLDQLLSDPQLLKGAANAALQHGIPDAAERLADLVEQTLRSGH